MFAELKRKYLTTNIRILFAINDTQKKTGYFIFIKNIYLGNMYTRFKHFSTPVHPNSG